MTTHKQAHTLIHTHTNTQAYNGSEIHKVVVIASVANFLRCLPLASEIYGHINTHTRKERQLASFTSRSPSPSLALTFSLLITLFTHFEYKIVMC